ncbi:unnamed protein product [Lepidochelys olivacea]
MWTLTTIVPSICPTISLTLPPSPANMGSPPSPASPTGPSPTALPPQHWMDPTCSAPPPPVSAPQQVLLFRHRGRGRLIKGIARAVGGSAEFITGQDRTQPKVLQSLKRALQPAVSRR